MAALKLVNNTGLKSEKNLCYVNTELQLLYSTPDVRSFFASKTYRENYQGRLLVCDELSRLFRTEGRFQTSAAELRRLVGQYYRREDICNGVQQDIVEFHTLLLGIIEVELARVGGGHSRFGNKFKGKEQTRRKFLNTPDGCCKQGHVSRTEEESFRVIKIDVPNTNRVISLNNIVSNHFSESTTTFGMKCSECCEHISNCPQTGKCKLKGATSQKFLISTPNILFIQLLRFDDFQGQKNETKITPENILVLPNEDKYKLVSIGNHLGPFINNGHYQALIKVGTSWIKADDTNVMKTNLQTEITGENYIFVYQKFSTTTQFVATNYWEEVFESQPVPPGLHVQLDTRTGKNYAKLLEESCDKKSQDKENDISKKASSSNPVRSSETTKNHLEEENNKTTKKTGKKESRSKVQKCTNVTEPINSRGKCKGCKQEFTDMNNHIKRSFPCQNHYKVVEE
jgi:ubiquitin C-terminal hydrolase